MSETPEEKPIPEQTPAAEEQSQAPAEQLTEQQVMVHNIVERFDKKPSKEIFVVLSERKDMNMDCLRVMKSMGLQPVIIYPGNFEGTIEEKFMQHPAIQFAFVILGGDDFIYDRLTGKPSSAVLGAKPSAIFHLGYLLGKFGRRNTFIVYKEQPAFKLPTLAHNAIFTPYEKNGSWQEQFRSRLNNVIK